MLAYLAGNVGPSCGYVGVCLPHVGPGWAKRSEKWEQQKNAVKRRIFWWSAAYLWGYVGPSWGYVGPSWGQCGPILGLCWPILGLCWPILRPMLAHLGAMLAHFEAYAAGHGLTLLSDPTRKLVVLSVFQPAGPFALASASYVLSCHVSFALASYPLILRSCFLLLVSSASTLVAGHLFSDALPLLSAGVGGYIYIYAYIYKIYIHIHMVTICNVIILVLVIIFPWYMICFFHFISPHKSHDMHHKPRYFSVNSPFLWVQSLSIHMNHHLWCLNP